MAREHYSKCTNPVTLQAIEYARTDGPHAFVSRIFEHGYDCAEEDISQTHTTALRELKESNRLKEWTDYKLIFTEQLRVESEALEYWKIRRHWAKTTSREDDTAKERERQQRLTEQRKQEAIERRAHEIVCAHEEVVFKKALEKARAELARDGVI